MSAALMIALILLAPLGVILLAQRVPALDRVGVVPLTFGLGFAVAILADLGVQPVQTTLAEVSVALALPLVIFAADLRAALRDAGGALRAMGAAFLAVVLASLAGALVFKGQIAQMPHVAGMSVGAYTGSGLNMGAIKTALGADETVFLALVTYDMVFSVVYMAVLLMVGQRLAGLLLRPYRGDKSGGGGGAAHLAEESAQAYGRLLARASLPGSALVLAAAVAVVGAGVGVAALFAPQMGAVVTILTITTLALLGSLVPALHRVRSSFHLGMYLILVFCFASATMLDTRILTQMDWALGGYFLFVIFGSMVVQALLCRLMDIDRDTYLVASGAAVMSVPFIPVIVGGLKNRALLVPGIAVAILGYALGNYLGLAVAAVVAAL